MTMSKQRNIALIDEFVEQTKDTFTPSTLKLYKSQLNTMADKFSFKTRQSTILKWFNTIENVNTKSNKLNAIILLRKHYNLTNDLLRDTREGNFKDIETHRKKSLKTLDDNLITYEDLIEKLNQMTSKWFMLNYMYVYYGLRNKDLNVVFLEELPEPELSILRDRNDAHAQGRNGIGVRQRPEPDQGRDVVLHGVPRGQ